MLEKRLSLTNLHWGLHGWAVYASLGLCFAFASYNKNKAFRVSSLLGKSVENNKPLSGNNRYHSNFNNCYRDSYITWFGSYAN
jgi:choline-glycine betaine transporter